jgi:hypothetical protein
MSEFKSESKCPCGPCACGPECDCGPECLDCNCE